MQVYQRFNTSEIRRSLQKVLYVEDWDSYEDWQRKYGNQSDSWIDFATVGSYFGGFVVFLEQGLLGLTMSARAKKAKTY